MATSYEILSEQAQKYEEARRIFIENDKALAETARLQTEISKMMAETRKTDSQARIETEKALAEIERLMAETRKINRETYWYPLILIGSAFTAGGALVGGLIKMLS
jgi:phage anti-repressor protein